MIFGSDVMSLLKYHKASQVLPIIRLIELMSYLNLTGLI